MSLKRTLRRAHGLVTRYAPTEVTVYRLTYAAAEDPFDATTQYTATTHKVRGTFAPERRDLSSVEDQATVAGTVTLNKERLGFAPSQGDRMAIGGVVFNVVEVNDVQGALVVCKVNGPAPAVA